MLASKTYGHFGELMRVRQWLEEVERRAAQDRCPGKIKTTCSSCHIDL